MNLMHGEGKLGDLRATKNARSVNSSSRFCLGVLFGSDGLGTLGGYVLFAVNSDYRRLVEAVFVLKQAA